MNTETLALKIEEQIYHKAVAAISGWNESDIYVASFYSWQDEDDPCKPRLTIGYNTERQYESALEEADGDANDARWNYAWFLQDEDAFCEHGGDAEAEELIRQWVASQGIDEEDWEACEPLEGAFNDILVRVVQRLHRDGVLKARLGREIPVLIHGLEYYEETLEINELANGAELLDPGFVALCNGE
jgi:hypothetical protein